MALPANYRRSEGKDSCGNCLFLERRPRGLWCQMWKARVEAAYIRDSWKPRVITVKISKAAN